MHTLLLSPPFFPSFPFFCADVSTDSKMGYCRLTFDAAGDLEEVVALFRPFEKDPPMTGVAGVTLTRMPSPPTASSLRHLIGLSEALFNGVVERVREGDVDDILNYLSMPWANALYHDRFRDFLGALLDALKGHSDFVAGAESLAMDAVKLGEAVDGLKEETRDMIESNVMRFLRVNENSLGMYIAPNSENANSLAGVIV
mmetsp:Transcript_34196/g.88309  ORF Transcript_34196/g.88309 Transcript_34196/m.88309 type:complete len:200 (-) Transcript_34196:1629-2228(-)